MAGTQLEEARREARIPIATLYGAGVLCIVIGTVGPLGWAPPFYTYGFLSIVFAYGFWHTPEKLVGDV